MPKRQKSDMATLTVMFETTVKSPLKGFYKFKEITLNILPFKESIPNLTAIMVSGIEDSIDSNEQQYIIVQNEEASEYSQLIVKTEFQVQIQFGASTKTKLESGEYTIPIDMFEPLKRDNILLVEDIIKYIAWKKRYEYLYGYESRIVVLCEWKVLNYKLSNHQQPQWSFDDHYSTSPVLFTPIHDYDFKEFYSLRCRGDSIPLYYELLLEVKLLLRYSKERSTYLILYAALEVGTKEMIKHLKPDTDWIISEVPSPDLYKIYNKYINEKVIPGFLTKQELNIIKDMTDRRNRIAHKGEAVPKGNLLKHYDFVKKLIDKIDNALGYYPTINTDLQST